MPNEINRRGRPPKNDETKVETNSAQMDETCSWWGCDTTVSSALFNCGVYDFFTSDQLRLVLENPVANHELAIRLSEFVYNKNGTVSNSIDYMVALMTLDKVITSQKQTSKSEGQRELMKSVLKIIDDKKFIRDALFTEMVDGTAFYYFETAERKLDHQKYLSDIDVEGVVEINSSDINASIITLPWQWCKIIGKKNGRYIVAFDLRYFDNYTGEKLERKLRKYPKEIVNGYNKRRDGVAKGNWIVLDSDKTMCRKIKCKDSEPWGRSLIIAALSDVLYKDYFVDTKRSVLDDISNKVVYQVFPENKQGNGSSLTKTQQENQHNTVKQAIMHKNTRGGTTFISLAAGTKLSSVDVSTDIFDDKNESNLNNDIAVDLGICASLIGAMSAGNYSSNTLNLSMITSQIYTWVEEWCKDLVWVINKNIIKDPKNTIGIYYFPTSFVNRQEFFDMMQKLYTSASGSLTFLIASTGVDPEVYMSVMDREIADGYDAKYKPHQTSYTMSAKQEDNENKAGRPTTDNPTDATIASRNNNGNNLPSPSDK